MGDCFKYPDVEDRVNEFILSLPCRHRGSYPSTEVKRENEHDAKLLLDAFADGESAELTAITQYINHSIQLRHLHQPGLANLELCISLIEMHHLDLVGELIRNLGLDPKYWRRNKFYWTGGYVSYDRDVCAILLADINAEKAAINAYAAILKEAEVEQVRKVVRRIREDEEKHLHLFKEAYESCCRREADDH